MTTAINIRAYHADDLEPLTDVYNAVSDAIGVERSMTPFILQSLITEAGDLVRDMFVVESAGRVIGFAGHTYFPAAGNAWGRGVVHPDFWRQGIGTRLVGLTDARLLERADAESPAGIAVVVERFLSAANTGAARLCEATGHTHIRDAYEMRIELNQPIETPPLPDGFALRPFEPEHAQVVYDAVVEAFADNRDSVEMSFEEWSNIMLNSTDIDPALWQVVYAGEQVAGFALNRLDDPEAKGMYVHVVGVRPTFRRRGLGEALLRHSFAVFRARGSLHAALHVDSANKTNAVNLYERAGMHVHNKVLVYRKILRSERE